MPSSDTTDADSRTVLYREKPGVSTDRDRLAAFDDYKAAIAYVRDCDDLTLKQGPGAAIGRDDRTGWTLTLRPEVADVRE